MARNRVIYQSQAVYAGPDKTKKGDEGWRVETGNHAPVQLKRIQSANYSFDIARTDVNQFGELAAIDRVVLESPTVSFDTSWYACNWYNEDKLGLLINTGTVEMANLSGILGDILTANADERNYYVRIVPEGTDAVGHDTGATDDTNNVTVGIGNGFLSNYTIEGAVGGFPTASTTVEALNIEFFDKISGNAPWVFASDGSKSTGQAANAEGATHTFQLGAATSSGLSTSAVSAIKPGNITLTLPSGQGGADLSGEGSVAIQSFNCSFDLAREPLNKLGSRFAFAREITFPVTATVSCDALVSEFVTGSLADIIDNNEDQQLVVRLDSDGVASTEHMAIIMKKAKLDSQTFSQGIGDNQTVTLNWSAQIGSKTQSGIGLFLSGDSV
ncbi:hypothetical protein CL634_11445 [bacterium]|nr:hypothetical protein [bacterium]